MTDEMTFCPRCKTAVHLSDNFCAQCGYAFHPIPPSTSIVTQISLYIGSILLPPFGIVWAIKYIRSAELHVRVVGWICIVLTLVSLIVATVWTKSLVYTLSSQINGQLNVIQSL